MSNVRMKPRKRSHLDQERRNATGANRWTGLRKHHAELARAGIQDPDLLKSASDLRKQLPDAHA